MKYRLLFIPFTFLVMTTFAQEKQNPIIKSFGSIYDVPETTLKPDPSLGYKIIIDVVTGSDDPNEVAWGLNNVARMLNLHAIGGVPAENMEVVLAIHGKAALAVLRNDAYKKMFEVDNPNIPLIKELKEAGVKMAICSQSLVAREVPVTEVLEEIEIATSMLTTVTMYQLKGYAVMKF